MKQVDEEYLINRENIKRLYEAIKQMRKNLDSCKDGDSSYQRCFNNLDELVSVAMDYITELRRN